jgi:MEDS: MEthanogen/methylotroph, DcmR Sensory domain
MPTSFRSTGSVLGAKRHICAFFHNRDEEYRVLLPFIKEGLKRGEKAFHIIDPEQREEHLERLSSAGIDVAAEETERPGRTDGGNSGSRGTTISQLKQRMRQGQQWAPFR